MDFLFCSIHPVSILFFFCILRVERPHFTCSSCRWQICWIRKISMFHWGLKERLWYVWASVCVCVRRCLSRVFYSWRPSSLFLTISSSLFIISHVCLPPLSSIHTSCFVLCQHALYTFHEPNNTMQTHADVWIVEQENCLSLLRCSQHL